MTSDTPWAEPLGLSRDPHWDDAWTDKKNRYVLPHPDDEFEKLVAGRASELGKTISNTFTLNRWHKEMVLRGLLIRKSILGRAALALANGFTKKQQSPILWDLCKEAEDVAGAKEPAALGTTFHEFTELYERGDISLDEVPEPWDRDLAVYVEVCRRMGIQSFVELTERIVWNRPVNIAGRYDRLWRYLRHCDKWHVGDLKTGRDLSYGWHEIAVQLQCYATATHVFNHRAKDWSEQWQPMPEMCTEVGLVMHVPSSGGVDENGEPTGTRLAALYEVDLTSRVQAVGTQFLMGGAVSPMELAVMVQQWRKTKRLQKMMIRVEILPEGEVQDVPYTVAELIDLCESREELEQLWADTKARKEWQGHHTTRANKRLEILSSSLT